MDAQTQKYSIDATGKRIGRLATYVASILNGKLSTTYAPNKVSNVSVEVTNIDDAYIDTKKQTQKTYFSHSQYLGHPKHTSMKNVIAKHGKKEVLVRAIKGMLPKNRLVSVKMRRLHIK